MTPHPVSTVPLTAASELPSGERLTLRPVRADDGARLGDYFAGVSAETRERYGPHPFDQATADEICATLDPADLLRMIATVRREGEERIVAYVLLKLGVLPSDARRYEERGLPLDPVTDCTLAPSVLDGYQNGGVGSRVMGHLLPIARGLGRRRMVLWGGVQATNERAVHFYRKWGFGKVGEFRTDRDNWDMILDLR